LTLRSVWERGHASRRTGYTNQLSYVHWEGKVTQTLQMWTHWTITSAGRHAGKVP